MNKGVQRSSHRVTTDFEDSLRTVLSHISICPRRLLLTTPDVVATVPMIRGVWGAALHDLDKEAYRDVFEGGRDESSRTPSYLLRPAPPDPDTAPAIEWISLGCALAYDPVLWDAWNIAAEMGLGANRRPFDIRSIIELSSENDPTVEKACTPVWTLDKAADNMVLDVNTPCTLVFNTSLRLIRKSRIVSRPTMRDIVIGGLRRLQSLVPESIQTDTKQLWGPALDIAGQINTEAWRGQRLDLTRWSARQQAEIELRGVAGSIELPDGAGPLFPLFAALQWIHIGKGTTIGLGQLSIQ